MRRWENIFLKEIYSDIYLKGSNFCIQKGRMFFSKKLILVYIQKGLTFLDTQYKF